MNYKSSKGFASEEEYDAIVDVLNEYGEENLIPFEDCFDSIHLNFNEDGRIVLSFKLSSEMSFFELSWDCGPVLTLTTKRKCTTASIGGMEMEMVGILSARYQEVLSDVEDVIKEYRGTLKEQSENGFWYIWRFSDSNNYMTGYLGKNQNEAIEKSKTKFTEYNENGNPRHISNVMKVYTLKDPEKRNIFKTLADFRDAVLDENVVEIVGVYHKYLDF